jgi:hypothetical protein
MLGLFFESQEKCGKENHITLLDTNLKSFVPYYNYNYQYHLISSYESACDPSHHNHHNQIYHIQFQLFLRVD